MHDKLFLPELREQVVPLGEIQKQNIEPKTAAMETNRHRLEISTTIIKFSTFGINATGYIGAMKSTA